MRKVVSNAEVAARAGAKDAVYADGGRVERIKPPAKPLDAGEVLLRLEAAVAKIPHNVVELGPVLEAVDASREALRAAIAAANKPRKFTMEHSYKDGLIVRTVVREE